MYGRMVLQLSPSMFLNTALNVECCAGVNECSRTKLIIVMYMLADSHFKTFFIKLEGSMFIGSTKSTHPF